MDLVIEHQKKIVILESLLSLLSDSEGEPLYDSEEVRLTCKSI